MVKPDKDTPADMVYTITELQQAHTMVVVVEEVLALMDIIDILDTIKLAEAKASRLISAELLHGELAEDVAGIMHPTTELLATQVEAVTDIVFQVKMDYLEDQTMVVVVVVDLIAQNHRVVGLADQA